MKRSHGVQVVEWVEELPERIAPLLRRWDVTPQQGLSGGTAGVVFTAVTSQGERRAVKVALPRTITKAPASIEHVVYRQWSQWGSGLVADLYGVDPDFDALLLELVVPGDNPPLDKFLPEYLGGFMPAWLEMLQGTVPPREALPVEDWMLRRIVRARPVMATMPPDAAQLVQQVYAQCAPTIAAAPYRRLVHGDVHHGNLVASQTSWKMIDPVGLAGPVELDVAFFAVPTSLSDSLPDLVDAAHQLGVRRDVLHAAMGFVLAEKVCRSLRHNPEMTAVRLSWLRRWANGDLL